MNQVTVKSDEQEWWDIFVENAIMEYEWWIKDNNDVCNGAIGTRAYWEDFYGIFSNSHAAYEEYVAEDAFDKPYGELDEDEEQEVTDSIFFGLAPYDSLDGVLEDVWIDRNYFVIRLALDDLGEENLNYFDTDIYNPPLQEVW